MAALSTVHSFCTTKFRSIHLSRFNSRSTHVCFSCISPEPIVFSDPKREKDKDNKVKQNPLSKLQSGLEKLGSGLKESLSPKQKGDWRDVVLMSLSFAVLVYISQQIVCAYCVWMSMLKYS